ncbi:protein preY, mitochondrial isoform X1 [Monodelphis domestica]|uniref:Protein preY, mitochondrial n=1 Tax=Monodelphis domestica TaxID=13616 RepID=F6RDY8_MONDO|nr:protein preY, mitochondrial isoform X1 [Monodelphis domestica]XP_056659301.1 protein preY, mitochondrial isoform X1 [Monodelphis domestica]
MLSSAVQRSVSALLGRQPLAWQVGTKGVHTAVSRPKADSPASGQTSPPPAFDPALLDFLVCPLSKKPLRYEMSTNELINEELGIAYPIIDGIPNMIPQAARMIHQNKQQEEKEPK